MERPKQNCQKHFPIKESNIIDGRTSSRKNKAIRRKKNEGGDVCRFDVSTSCLHQGNEPSRRTNGIPFEAHDASPTRIVQGERSSGLPMVKVCEFDFLLSCLDPGIVHHPPSTDIQLLITCFFLYLHLGNILHIHRI